MEQTFGPDFGETGPMPELKMKLLEPQVGGRMNWGKDRELKGGIGEGEKDQNQPKPLKPKNAAQTVAERNPDGIRQEHDHVTSQHPEHRAQDWRDRGLKQGKAG